MSKTVLIVDDDPNVHDILRTVLGQAGYQVASAMDAMQGPMMARNLKPDLIVLDIMMPAGGGVSVYKRIRQNMQTMSIPVIIHSSTTPEAIRPSMPEIDQVPMVQKPADLKAFVALADKLTGTTRS